MGLEFHITDNSGVFKNAKEEQVQRAMESVGLHLEGEAADELENSPRRVDTGRLKGSINHRTIPNGVEVGTGVEYAIVEYAIYVHFGTRKMEANAFLKNAFERNMDQVREYIIRELKG